MGVDQYLNIAGNIRNNNITDHEVNIDNLISLKIGVLPCLLWVQAKLELKVVFHQTVKS